ncbi:MAG TPA: TonB-dependent receptor, partial [Brevundimonas sp.]|nr:TonB-dependent receptor [Brevundimonas sp.]
GARADWAMGENRLTMQGDIFDNEVAVNEGFSGEETRVSGHNVLARWTRPLGGGELQVQGFYDRFERAESGGIEDSDTWDLTAQHSFGWNRHQFVVGAGYRTVQSRFVAPPGSAFLNPPERTLGLTNIFVQDQISLSDALVLTLGAKFEDNSFSGDQFLPNARLAWRLGSGDLAWAAVSRASRTPNRIERDLTLPGFLIGGNFQSETLTAWEVGYRARPRERLSFSISAFYNVYDDLRTASFAPVTVFPISLTNFGEGESGGIEAWGSYDVSDRWRLSAGLNTLEKDFGVDPDGSDITGLASIGDDPAYQLLLTSQSQLTDSIDLDVRLRALDALDPSGVESYVEADVRLGWRVRDGLELSLSGRNLIEDRHLENGDAARARAFGRSVLVALRADF